MAILGTTNFDVSTVDPVSIRLAGVAPLAWHVEDIAAPTWPFIGKQDCLADCTTAGPDGLLDLSLKFDHQAIVAAIGAVNDEECVVVRLTGNLLPQFGGTPIVGEDVVVMLHTR